ncbi:MAG: hypothetical protein LBO66_03680 [Deltaproteobacteria bacterium]|jgi:hypothetical protein|nr:hypothetical protein [Deltaproteobacteria bacterium]
MANRHKIFLTDEERIILDNIVKKGKKSASVIVMSLILLSRDKSPEGRGVKNNARISQELNISERTIESAKRRFVEGGINSAAQRSPTTVNTI